MLVYELQANDHLARVEEHLLQGEPTTLIMQF